MNMSIGLRLIKISIWFAILVLGFIFLTQKVNAVSPDVLTSQYGVTYPIEGLDGCIDYDDCHTYCEDPVNWTACADYAKDKGFYVEDSVHLPDNVLFQKVKDALGCTDRESCEQICSDSANFEKCAQFARDNGMSGGYVGVDDDSVWPRPPTIDAARDELGCDSAESCLEFCSQEANREKCDQFAAERGIRGGERLEGPGNCTEEGTCQAYCSDPNNFTKCSVFAKDNGGSQFTGPGGCTTPEECRTYCEQNADNCRSIAPFSSGRYVPVACPEGEFFGPGGACTPVEKTTQSAECASENKYWNGDNCQDDSPPGINTQVQTAYFQPRPDMGNCTTPGGCYDFCKANAGKCGGFNGNFPRPSETYLPSVYYTPGAQVKIEPRADMGNCDSPGGCYDFCKTNAGKCQGFDGNSPRPLDSYVPAAYYTPPSNFVYPTPPATNYYVTPVYYSPPVGSNYSTPSYYTPGIYSSPSYYSPSAGSNYSTPSYYTPGSYTTPFNASNYSTPPAYATPRYYTPPSTSNYTTPTYYSPSYYTPYSGSNYTTPSYNTPTYYTPYTGGSAYSTPVYYTPPPGSNYVTPLYGTPPPYYSPYYYSPVGTTGYNSPTYSTPNPAQGGYYTPGYSPGPDGTPYPTPTGNYSYPTPSSYYTPSSYSYPTPGTSYSYPTPSSYSYPTPSSYSYPTPSYGSPTYETPSSYSYPTPVLGVKTNGQSLWDRIIGIFVR